MVVHTTTDDPAVTQSKQWRVVDRKSTRLNSRHRCSSYAVLCLRSTTSRHSFPTRRSSDLQAAGIALVVAHPRTGSHPGVFGVLSRTAVRGVRLRLPESLRHGRSHNYG